MGRTFVNKENRLSGSGGIEVFDVNRNKYPGTHGIVPVTPFLTPNARKDDTTGATPEMKQREKAAREEMTSDKGKVGLALAKKGMAGDKITTQD